MNILILVNSMVQPDDTDKGKTDVVFYFAKMWSRAGHRVLMIHNESRFPYLFYKLPSFVYSAIKKHKNVTIPSAQSRKELRREEDGVKIFRLPMFKLLPHSGFSEKQYKKQSDKIKAILEKESFTPDVVTGHWLEPQLKLVNDLGNDYGAKKALVVHGSLPTGLSGEYQEYIRQLDCLFFRSEYRKGVETARSSAFFPANVKVCYSGIPDGYLENMINRDDWKKNGRLTFVFVGRLIAYKRIDATLRALDKAFPDHDFTFNIIGDGSEKQNLIDLTNALHINECVHFLGRISRDEVIRQMQASDCFVMISENEVFGLVYLEAMAAGCLTVASKNGGVDGIIVDKVNGFLCDQGNADSLAETIREINSLSKEDVSRIRNSASQTVVDFSDSKVAERYLRDIVGQTPAS